MNKAGTNPNLQRAMILHQQRRYADAERELRLALGADPSNAEIFAMLALCLVELKRLPEATEAAQQATGLAPDEPFPFYALASVLVARNRPDEALAPIQHALSLNAHNPAYLAALSGIYYQLRQWPAALDAAERGLRIDPEHEQCVNLRAIALVNLGRRAEAGAAIGAALQRNPEDATTHANQGWTYLHQGDHKKAMIHFREALRLEPELKWARAGMVESLKARNPIYKVMLAYFLFMGRLSGQAQWVIVVGGYFGVQILKSLEHSYPALAPLVLPLMVLYTLFAIMTWVASPLFNLLLRLDRFGRHALSREQTWAANFTGATLLAAIALGVLAWKVGSVDLVFAALGTMLFMIPVSVMFRAPAGWPQIALIAYAVALGTIGVILLSAIIPAAIHHRPMPAWTATWSQAYLYGFILHQFVANALIMTRVKR